MRSKKLVIRRIILIFSIFVLTIVIYNGYRLLVSKKYENARLGSEITGLESDIESEEKKIDELNKTKKDREITDEDYEDFAREELGLIKKDEIVIKPR